MKGSLTSYYKRSDFEVTVKNKGMKRMRRGIVCCLLLMTAVLLLPQRAKAEQAAEDLSKQCQYGGSVRVHADRLTDDDFESAQRVEKNKVLFVSWTDDVSVASVLLSFYFDPVAYTVTEYDASGATLSETNGTLLWNNLYTVQPETRKIAFRADAENFALCSLYAYGAGTVPDYHPFEPTPEKADYMLIAMHPDDDVLFLGAIIPTYGVKNGLEGVAVYMGTRLRIRRQEALNGAWTMGLKTLPVFGGFPDIPPDYYEKYGDTFTKDDVIRYIVTMLRTYRPEVVVTQDLEGEYGHWQHKLLAKGVSEAVPLAADPDYQPKGYPVLDPWNVKKLYLHLYPENRIQLNVNEPIEGLEGKTAFEIAKEAFQCHRSQLHGRHSVTNQGIYSLSDFGLAYTTVGNDTPLVNDMFEHIDPSALTVTPSPEPTEAPTEEPTDTPSPAPTQAPSAVPTEAPTAVAETPAPTVTEAPTPKPVEPQPATNRTVIWLLGGGFALLLILLMILLIARKRR